MLQQTQVSRVTGKFREFMQRFPKPVDLAAARPAEVIASWSGLGYNRRALFLQRAAAAIVRLGGKVPRTADGLQALPGIGPHTAGAILAYAYNQPALFIETNIRRALIAYFFSGNRASRSQGQRCPTTANFRRLAAGIAIGQRQPRTRATGIGQSLITAPGWAVRFWKTPTAAAAAMPNSQNSAVRTASAAARFCAACLLPGGRLA